jgi:hypothetical protein
MPIEVEVFSAAWCKRCQTVKPEVEAVCRVAGANYAVVDYDELDENENAFIKSLPTIRMRADATAGWLIFTAATLEDFKKELTKLALLHSYDDF